MPLYVGDYISDTTHLTAAQHGAYLLLLMHYWQRGGLPDDDRQLAVIARMSPKEWKRERSIISAFFQDGWKHKRIEFELTEAARISEAGRKGGLASGKSRQAKSNNRSSKIERPLNDICNDPPTNVEALQSPSQEEDSIGNASAFTEGSKALASVFWKALGFERSLEIPPEFAGVDWRAIEWERAGYPADMIAVEAKRIGPGKPLSYHEKVFATAFAKLQAPLPKVEIREAETLQVSNGSHQRQSGSVAAAFREIRQQLEGEAEHSGEAGGNPVLRLSSG